MPVHRILLGILYLLTLAAMAYLVVIGSEYYRLPRIDRPHHALHAEWKPSGGIGHGVGIVGSLLMVTLLLYSARKRLRALQSWGNIRYWLNYHIWMGVTGPLLVIFHTSFKLGGIVAVSFWSMIGVALSGVIGRYIYSQIPHSLSGQELSARELDELDRAMLAELEEKYRVDAATLTLIQTASSTGGRPLRHGWAGLWDWFLEDIALPGKLQRIRQRLRVVKRFQRSANPRRNDTDAQKSPAAAAHGIPCNRTFPAASLARHPPAVCDCHAGYHGGACGHHNYLVRLRWIFWERHVRHRGSCLKP